MADTELEELRAKRLAELQKQYSGKVPDGVKNNEREQKAREEEEELRNHILSQVLTQEARGRLSTIAVAKPEKGKMVENMLINMARIGQLQGKLQESDLIHLLEQVSEQTSRKTTVKFDRRRAALDDSDEDF